MKIFELSSSFPITFLLPPSKEECSIELAPANFSLHTSSATRSVDADSLYLWKPPTPIYEEAELDYLSLKEGKKVNEPSGFLFTNYLGIEKLLY